MENNSGEIPVIFSNQEDYAKYSSTSSTFIVNAFERQLKELFLIENSAFIGESKEKVYSSEEFLKFQKDREKDFVYVYYPWNHHLVKTVKEEDYFKLITNRNKDLITEEEQKKLYNYKVAVFGMSVGSNISLVLTQAGIAKNIIIADFDDLDTSNLNRIIAGLHQVGLNKTTIAARRIYEYNPFANITQLKEGITKDLLEELLNSKKIDCIIEEIDQMQMKIETRKLAYKYKIPVLMVTDNGDYGVLHIERYDLGYDKIYEKDLSYWDERMKSYEGKKDFADIVINTIVGGPEKVDPRMLASAQRVVAKELISWPQLGSAALLGGIAVTYALKQIIRKENEITFTKEYLIPLNIQKHEHITT
jgi:molybdopterin/thiamine biosynthesis adenylyltransferase